MGAYNSEATIQESIRSIQAQTYGDWEFVICDDASSDSTRAIVEDCARVDRRIRLITNEQNIGLARTLNRCADIARGEYFARQDADDISEPSRLAALVQALDENPRFALVSSWMSCFDEEGEWGLIRTKPFPGRDDLVGGPPFCHAPCMMRRTMFESLGGYGQQPWLRRGQDYDMWFRMYAAGFSGMNLQEPLYRMRNDHAAVKRRNFRTRWSGFLVEWYGYKLLGFGPLIRLKSFRSLFFWLLPDCLYSYLYRRRLRENLSEWLRQRTYTYRK